MTIHNLTDTLGLFNVMITTVVLALDSQDRGSGVVVAVVARVAVHIIDTEKLESSSCVGCEEATRVKNKQNPSRALITNSKRSDAKHFPTKSCLASFILCSFSNLLLFIGGIS